MPQEYVKVLSCSFCGKSQREVKKLIAGPLVYICDGCIDLCNSIIVEEAASKASEAEAKPATIPVEIPVALRGRDTTVLRERVSKLPVVLLRREPLVRENAALLVIDIQERLSAAMNAEQLARVVRNTEILIEAAKTLEIPIFATEQYPKGLGPTLPSLKSALADIPLIPKVAFSSLGELELAKKLNDSTRTHIIVAGMESHVCVYQTTRDLIAQGYSPFVPRDAVLSRTQENYETGLDLMREAGATITSTEAIVFDLLGAAGTPEFKKLSALMK